MSTVQSWVVGVLEPDTDEQQAIKVTIRLDAPDYYELQQVASRLGISNTRAATGLLQSAIADARQFLSFSDEQKEELPA
jgi:hypothetical protein